MNWEREFDLKSARVVLEPRAGGDLYTEVGGRRVVDQLKSRTTGRRWSLYEFIERVLPDLCNAASDSGKTVYRFVTEGQLANWGGFWSLQESISRAKSAGAKGLSLDANQIIFRRPRKTKTAFWEHLEYTEQSLFDHIVVKVHSRMARTEPDRTLDSSRGAVRRVLGSFEVVQGVKLSWLERQIDTYLLQHGAESENVRQRRDSLVGRMVSLASSNGSVISPADLFAGASLTPVALDDIDALSTELKALAQVRQDADEYDPAFDVRRDRASAVARVALRNDILMVGGEPGNGKTWMSHAIGDKLLLMGELAVRPQPSGEPIGDVERAARDFWEKAVRGDRPFSMARLAERLRYSCPGRSRLLTVIIDGVQNPADMDALVKLPWHDWRVGLVALVSKDVAEAFEVGNRRVQSITIEEFTAQERELYLTKRIGARWSFLPSDVLRLLKKPLLAALYCELSAGEFWQPEDEYHLFDRYWHERLSGPETRVAAPARVGLCQLASRTLAVDREMAAATWNESTCLEAFRGNGEALELALESGWLKASRDRYEFAHDRLLNWCVAKSLSDAHGASEEEAVAKRLREVNAPGQRFAGRYLGYVPMDLLWMVTRRLANRTAFAARLLSVLEEDSWATDDIYGDRIRTLGEEAGPALLHRLREVVDEGELPRTRAIVEAASATGSAALGEQAVAWLQDGAEPRLLAAFLILARDPRPEAAELLWAHYRRVALDSAGEPKFYDQRLCFSALEACVCDLPNWVRSATENAPPDKCMRALAAILRDRPDGAVLWRELSRHFIAKMPTEDDEAIAVSLRRYGDRARIGWLQSCIRRNEGWGPGFAFEALVVLDPEVALLELAQIPASRLTLHLERGLHALLHLRGDSVRRIILRRIRRSNDEILLLECFAGRQNSLDRDLLGVGLERLGESARRAVDGDIEAYRLLERLSALLTGVTRVELLRVLEARRGSELESNLLQWLCCLEPRGTPRFEPVRSDVLTLLVRLGSRRILEVVGPWLHSGSPSAIRDALSHLYVLPRKEAKKVLLEAALEDSAGSYKFTVQLVEALASIDGWGEAVRVLVERGVNNRSVLGRLVAAREARGPLSDEELAPARRALKSDPKSVGALAALSISGRRSFVGALRAAFHSAAEGSDLAVTALHGYTILEASDALDLEFLRSQLKVERLRDVAVRALAMQESERALDILVEDLERNYDDQLADFLSERDSTCQRALAATWSAIQCTSAAHSWWPMEHLSKLDDDDVRDYLREQAYHSVGPVTGEYFHGPIRALSAFDRESAFVAAERRLRDSGSIDADHASYARVLLGLDAPRAVQVVLDRAIVEEGQLPARILAEALAFAFKESGLPDLVETRLKELLHSRDAASRVRACRLVGWLNVPGTLLEEVCSLVVDPDERVASAALKVVFHQEATTEASDLLSEIESEQDAMRRCWLLDAVLESYDFGLTGPLPHRALAIIEREIFFTRERLIDRALGRRKKLRKVMRDDDKRQHSL